MARKSLLALALAAAMLAGCSTVSQHSPRESSGPITAQEALRPFYDSLEVVLPVAPPGPKLAADSIITRIAFGSCVNENGSMAFWDVIASKKPQAFLLIGDNVYGDSGSLADARLPSLLASYKRLLSRQEFDRFRRTIPMLTTWDDHDMGANDAGGSFAFKEYAEEIYESFWGVSETVKSRGGVYDSLIAGPVGKRVQFIMLDTRFFRADLVHGPYRDTAPASAPSIASHDPKATMLGEAQWAWLASELSKPADLRFIISSIQVATNAHSNEGWRNLPLEREKLNNVLALHGINNAIILSGNRHAGAFYRSSISGQAKPVWEFTSSSLNYAFGNGDDGAKEPDPVRQGGLWTGPNFGQIDIDWTTKSVTMTLKREDGTVLERQVVNPFN
jgi:alkaline phosphatase D